MSLREALREQWAVVVLTSAGLLGIVALFGLVAPDGRLGQADRATYASHEAPAGLRHAVGIADAGEQ